MVVKVKKTRKKAVKKRTIKPVVVADDDELDIDDADFEEIDEPELFDDDETDELAIRRVLGELGEDAEGLEICVQRVIDKHQKEYLTKYNPNDFSLDLLRDEWGGGKFKIYARNDLGHYVINRIVNIASRPNQPTQELRQDNNNVIELLSKMMEHQARQTEEFKTLMLNALLKNNSASSNAVNPNEMITSMVTAMAAMKKLSGDSAPKTDPMDTMLNAFELAEKFGSGGGGGETGMFDVMKEVIKQAGGPLAAAAASAAADRSSRPAVAGALVKAQQPKPVQRAPVPDGQVPAQPQSIPEENAMPSMLGAMLKHQLKNLLKLAANDRDPELYAEVLLDNIPEAYEQQFVNFITQPDCLSQLLALNPEVHQYYDWFEQLRDHIIEIINLASAPEDDEGDIVDADLTNDDMSAIDTGNEVPNDGAAQGKQGN